MRQNGLADGLAARRAAPAVVACSIFGKRTKANSSASASSAAASAR
jgi:hypothetical protein